MGNETLPDSPDLLLPALLSSFLDRRSLDRKGFVKRMGYENMTRGLRRFDQYLDGESLPEHPDQLRRLSTALEIAQEQLEEIAHIDRQRLRAYQTRKAQNKRTRDGRYHIWIRYYKYFAGSRRYLEETLTEREAIERAREMAREEGEDRPDTPPEKGGFLLRLNTPNLRTYTIDASGSILNVYEPDVSPVKEGMYLQ